MITNQKNNTQQYIQLSKKLLTDYKAEGEIRVALSRYYYGLLHDAICNLVRIGTQNSESLSQNLTCKPDSKYSIHGDTIREVQICNSVVGADLDIAKRLRIFADYDFSTMLDFPFKVQDEDNHVLKTFLDVGAIKIFLEKLEEDLNKLQKKSLQSTPRQLGKIEGLAQIRQQLK